MYKVPALDSVCYLQYPASFSASTDFFLIFKSSTLVISESLSFCCPDEVCCPSILLYAGGFTKMHFQLQLVLSVEKSLIKRQWAGVLLCELWTKWGSTFYICLAFQCSQWKIK